jgi:hypothetical protein
MLAGLGDTRDGRVLVLDSTDHTPYDTKEAPYGVHKRVDRVSGKAFGILLRFSFHSSKMSILNQTHI